MHAAEANLRVLTWNVMGTGSPQGLADRADLIANVVDEQSPQVLLVQEAWGGLLETLAARCGLFVAAEASYLGDGRLCAVLCRRGTPVRSGAHTLALPGSQSGYDYLAVAAAVSLFGREWGLVSAHLPWGGRCEAARAAAVVSIDRWLEELLPYGAHPVVLGADMNAGPDSVSWRTLVGLDAPVRPPEADLLPATSPERPAGPPSQKPTSLAPGPFWVDVFATAGTGPGETTGPEVAPLAAQTAASFEGATFPQLEPPRRIDGVFARGWCHGRTGGPMSARVLGDATVLRCSDHLPVQAELIG